MVWAVSGINWIDLAEDKDKCRSVINALMNVRFHKIGKHFDCLRNSYFLRKDTSPWS